MTDEARAAIKELTKHIGSQAAEIDRLRAEVILLRNRMKMETRTVHDPFLDQTVEVSNRLVDRLRGRYANGPTLTNGEPEFGWREFQTPPIQHEAADEIERLRAALYSQTKRGT